MLQRTRRERPAPALIAAGGWLAAYSVVAVAGQRFSTAYLDYGWQIVPWEVLRDDPLGSVVHLHIQPPLWNLVLGGAAWLSPLSDALTLQLVQVSFGVVLAWFLADMLVRLGCSAAAAVGLALVASLNPEVLRGGFEPTYELPVAALLAGCLWSAVRVVQSPSALRLAVLAGLATAVVLTRSLYHPVWAVAVVAGVAFATRRRLERPWRAVGLAVLVPVVACGAWMAKNEVLFHRATMSSWVGMNLQRSTIPVLAADELEQLLDAGEVSDVARIGPFGNYGLYEPVMAPCEPEHDHPAVTVEERFDDHGVLIPNFNYECFIPVFDRAGDDARTVIGEHPDVWVEGRLWSARTTFAVSGAPAESRSWPLRALDTAYRLLRVDVVGTIDTSSWGTPIYGTLAVESRFTLVTAALAAGLSVGAVVAAARLARRRDGARDTAWAVAIALGGFVVLYTFVVGAVGELGEQARFRTMTDPITVAVGAAAGLRLLSRRYSVPWLFRAGQAAAVGR